MEITVITLNNVQCTVRSTTRTTMTTMTMKRRRKRLKHSIPMTLSSLTTVRRRRSRMLWRHLPNRSRCSTRRRWKWWRGRRRTLSLQCMTTDHVLSADFHGTFLRKCGLNVVAMTVCSVRRDILCSVHHEIRQNKATATDLVVTICSNWPLNASYPMHLGAMLQMMIEDENKKELYGFIVEHEHYPILQSALKQYAGTELQGHIKQMANLCRTVGAEKFCSLSINILDAIKTVLEGGAFELDFAPLLMATTPKQKKPTPQPTSPMTLKQSGKGDEVWCFESDRIFALLFPAYWSM